MSLFSQQRGSGAEVGSSLEVGIGQCHMERVCLMMNRSDSTVSEILGNWVSLLLFLRPFSNFSKIY